MLHNGSNNAINGCHILSCLPFCSLKVRWVDGKCIICFYLLRKREKKGRVEQAMSSNASGIIIIAVHSTEEKKTHYAEVKARAKRLVPIREGLCISTI